MSKLHVADLKTHYAIKLCLQSCFDQPRAIATLAHAAGISGQTLRRLFRQAFGLSVFEYYQVLRLQEATRMFKEQHLTVAEVGYRVSFANLSHFARVFEAQFGMKPKKYSGVQ